MHTYIHTYIHTHTQTHIYIYIHAHIHTYMHAYTYTYTYICMCIQVLQPRVHLSAHTTQWLKAQSPPTVSSRHSHLKL